MTAFKQGYDAYEAGWSNESNPYCLEKDNTAFCSWHAGWKEAQQFHADHIIEVDISKIPEQDDFMRIFFGRT